jgi:hypothetical protein
MSTELAGQQAPHITLRTGIALAEPGFASTIETERRSYFRLRAGITQREKYKEGHENSPDFSHGRPRVVVRPVRPSTVMIAFVDR